MALSTASNTYRFNRHIAATKQTGEGIGQKRKKTTEIFNKTLKTGETIEIKDKGDYFEFERITRSK